MAGSGTESKVFGLESERLLELEVVCGVTGGKIGLLEDGGNRDQGLLPCERSSLR